MMTQEELDMDNPGQYGIQDPEAPGEPDYWGHPVSQPVPGTAKETRAEHEGLRGGQHDTSEGTGHTSGGGRDSH